MDGKWIQRYYQKGGKVLEGKHQKESVILEKCILILSDKFLSIYNL